MFDFSPRHFLTPEAFAFYAEYANATFEKLLLKFAKKPEEKAWAVQLDARKRAEKKLPTWSKTAGIVFPPKQNLAQASSEITAKYKAELCSYNSSADLTGGTGIDSWQFAKHSKKHVYVEPNADLCALAKHNFGCLNLEQTTVHQSTAEEFLKASEETFDFIFIDPSRKSESGKKVIALEHYLPNVIELEKVLLARAKNVLIKVSPFADITYLKNLFPNTLCEIHIVSVLNECKEVLLLLQEQPQNPPEIKTVNFSAKNVEVFSFNHFNAPLAMADEVETFLCEPNASVLKSGDFGTICKSFDLKKLDKNSHLFTTAAKPISFPGQVYRVVETSAPYKLKGNYTHGSIISRNFPDKPESIRKRLKLQEGTDVRIFATTCNKKRIFIVGKNS